MKRTDITALFPDATDEQIKTIMDLNGADINKAKGDLDELKTKLATANDELAALKNNGGNNGLEEVTSKIAALQEELARRDQADAIRAMRDKVATENKVPATLLTGETEEACAEQAKAILAFAKTAGYPHVKDGGEPQNIGITKEAILAIKNERERLKAIQDHIDLF